VIRHAWILAAALSLGACSVLPEKSPVALYGLSRPAALEDAPAEPIALRLAVEKPAASGPLASPWILVRRDATRIEVYPDAQWSEPLPGLVGKAILEAFEADGRLSGVERAASGLAHDFSLLTELRDFQIELDEAPVAVVRVKASLVDAARGEAVASRLFEARVPAAGREVGEAVAALDAATAQVLAAMRDWLIARQSRPSAED